MQPISAKLGTVQPATAAALAAAATAPAGPEDQYAGSVKELTLGEKAGVVAGGAGLGLVTGALGLPLAGAVLNGLGGLSPSAMVSTWAPMTAADWAAGAIVGGAIGLVVGAGFGIAAIRKAAEQSRTHQSDESAFARAAAVDPAASPTASQWQGFAQAGLLTGPQPIPESAMKPLGSILANLQSRGATFDYKKTHYSPSWQVTIPLGRVPLTPDQAAGRLKQGAGFTVSIDGQSAEVNSLSRLQFVDCFHGGGFPVLEPGKRELAQRVKNMMDEGFRFESGSQAFVEAAAGNGFAGRDVKLDATALVTYQGKAYWADSALNLDLLDHVVGKGPAVPDAPPAFALAERIEALGGRVMSNPRDFPIHLSSNSYEHYQCLDNPGEHLEINFPEGRRVLVPTNRVEGFLDKMQSWGAAPVVEQFDRLEALGYARLEDQYSFGFGQSCSRLFGTLMDASKSPEELKAHTSAAIELLGQYPGDYGNGAPIPEKYFTVLDAQLKRDH